MLFWVLGVLTISSIATFWLSRIYAKPYLNYWSSYTIGVVVRLAIIMFFLGIYSFLPNTDLGNKITAFYGIALGLFIVYLAHTFILLKKAKGGRVSFKQSFGLFLALIFAWPNVLCAEGFNISEVIAHHLVDAPLWKMEFYGIDLSITKRVVMMWVGALFLFVLLIPTAQKIAKNPYQIQGRFANLLEVFVNFVRKDVAEGVMGHHSHPYEPLLLTFFFFILVLNLLGLVPPLGELVYTLHSIFSGHSLEDHQDSLHLPLVVKLWPGITATGDISVTAALATISFFVILLTGFIYQGVLFIRNIVPSGVHWSLFPLMWVIELAGLLTKPFALAIRLLANMTAGHLIIIVLLGFIFQFQSWGIVPISLLGSVAIYLLEIFVAFLQAYIFTFLTALFIGGVQHRH